MTISTTPRKIVSMDGSYNSFNFPELDSIQYEPPVVAITTVFSEVLTFDDEGNETGTETISTEIEIKDDDLKEFRFKYKKGREPDVLAYLLLEEEERELIRN